MSKYSNNEEILQKTILNQLNNSSNNYHSEDAKDYAENITKATLAFVATPNDNNFEEYREAISTIQSEDLGKIINVISKHLKNAPEALIDYIQMPLVEQTTQAHKNFRDNELREVTSEGIADITKQNIKGALEDRLPANLDQFQKSGVKPGGVSSGNISKKTTSQHEYLLKGLHKTNDAISNIADDKERDRAYIDRVLNVQELIAAPIYNQLLYNRAPTEQLIIDKDSDMLYVGSKFLSDSTALEYIPSNEYKKLNIKGFEKAIAASQFLGDNDYHLENLMLNEGDKTNNTISKIDHGKSFMEVSNNFNDTIDLTYEHLKSFGYYNYIQNGDMNFNINEYSSSLKQMLAQITPEQINNIIDHKIDELQKTGFDPNGMSLSTKIEGDTPISDYDDLRKFFKDQMATSIKNMQEVSKNVEIISKYSNVSDEFKNGGWIKELAESSEKDPIKFAIANNIEIENKDPKIWLAELDKKKAPKLMESTVPHNLKNIHEKENEHTQYKNHKKSDNNLLSSQATKHSKSDEKLLGTTVPKSSINVETLKPHGKNDNASTLSETIDDKKTSIKKVSGLVSKFEEIAKANKKPIIIEREMPTLKPIRDSKQVSSLINKVGEVIKKNQERSVNPNPISSPPQKKDKGMSKS